MIYYVLNINGKNIRNFRMDGGGIFSKSMLWVEYTDDLNLAYKFTRKEVMESLGDIKNIINYLNTCKEIDGVVEIKDWSLVEVNF